MTQDNQQVYWGLHRYTLKPLYHVSSIKGYDQLYTLISYENNKWQLHRDIDSTSIDILKDHQNIIWVIGHEHLLKYDGMVWEKYDLPIRIPYPGKAYLTADSQGNIWLSQEESEIIHQFSIGGLATIHLSQR